MPIAVADPTAYNNDDNKATNGQIVLADLNTIIAVTNANTTNIASITSSAFSFSGLKTFTNGIATDTVAEYTSAAGVTVDGLLIKDGWIAKLVGIPMYWPGQEADIPAGSILLYGQAISRSTYSRLRTLWGDIYGAGDGSTTFNTPDYRECVIIGKGNMGASTTPGRISSASLNGGNASTLGGRGGEQATTLTAANMQHNHSIPSNGTLADPSNNNYRLTSQTTGNVALGSNTAHNNMNPWMAQNFICFY